MRQLEITDERERKLAQHSARSLHGFLETRLLRDQPFCLQVSGDGEHKTVRIPSSLAHAMLDALEALGAGRSVVLESLDEELTTQEAADLLQVSRPYLIEKLLETGRIPFHKVGNRRRIRLADVMRYKRERQERRKEALHELEEEAQELEMGYE